jgi:uncharacterized protein
MLVKSRYVVASPALSLDGAAGVTVVFSTRSQRAVVMARSLWQAVEERRFSDLPAAVRDELADADVLVPEGTDELALVLAESRRAAAASTTLYECLQPSAACNLGCGYCGQAHRRRTLDAEAQAAIAARVDKKLASERYRLLRIGWFGAEPLAGLDTIRSLTAQLRKTAARHRCAYDAHMVTNGFSLSPAVADELVDGLGVSEVEITLDGPPETHDRRRATKAGRPTFDRILKNLIYLAGRAPREVRVVVRCNVDRSNAADVPALIELLARHELGSRVDLYFAPIHDWSNGADEAALDAAEYAHEEIEWLAHAARRGFRPALLPAAKPVVCMAVNPHAELIDPYGQVFNCSEAPLVPAYGHPNSYALETLDGPRSSPAAERLAHFWDDVADGRFGCSRCPMLPVCGGACPKQWHEGRAPCPSAKKNLGERLMLALALSQLSA